MFTLKGHQLTVIESARRLAKMTDKDLMITCGGGYGKPKQEAMLADLHALTEYVLGERESSQVKLLRQAIDELQ